MTQLRIEHAQIVQHPRNGLVVIPSLECAQAGGVARLGCDEIASHVEEDPAILLDHSEQADVPRSAREFGGLGVESFALGKVATALGDDGETVERVGFGIQRSGSLGLNETLSIAAVCGLGLTQLALNRALPPQCVGENDQVLLTLECLDSVVVKTKRPCRFAAPFRFACLLDEATRYSPSSLRHSGET